MQKNIIGNHFNVKTMTINMVCIQVYCFTKMDQVKLKFQLDGLPQNQEDLSADQKSGHHELFNFCCK